MELEKGSCEVKLQQLQYEMSEDISVFFPIIQENTSHQLPAARSNEPQIQPVLNSKCFSASLTFTDS